MDLIAGMAVENLSQAPEGLVLREVHGTTFAVVECGMDEIGPTWGFIYGEWLANSERYAEDESNASFEYYPPGIERGQGLVSIHVAIKAKQ